MAFCFKRKQPVAKGIRRLGRNRVKQALACLADCRGPEAIHCVRKEIKKARAVLQLARSRIRKKDYRRLNKRLQKAAKHLATVRDAQVRCDAFEHLAVHSKGQLGTPLLRNLRAALQSNLRAERRRLLEGKTLGTVERILKRAASEFDALSLRGKGWQGLCPGVKRAYRRGCQAYCAAAQDPSPERLHEWRKRVKELWYQMRMLQPVWPEQLDAVGNELEILGDNLGDDRDLFLLQKSLQRRNDVVQSKNETIEGLIKKRQSKLRHAALTLGARFYAEKPSAFTSRLGRYWQVWRKGEMVR
jgi:CHAD domain-containing protein